MVKESGMSERYTIGIEEEFQIVVRNTGQLSPQLMPLLQKGSPFFGDQIKPEMLQPTVELISKVYPNIIVARSETKRLRARLASMLAEDGLALISAGTNPGAHWTDQLVTPNPRYHELLEEFQDVGRSILIFGLHIHIAVENNEIAVILMNQLRTWLPHLLALSSNSPLWSGRLTSLQSQRTAVWKRLPRSGLPDTFQSWNEFNHYVHTLIETGCIDNGKKIWWDIRPHPFFGTVEFRIFDMPLTLNDVIGIAAVCQSLLAKLSWLHKNGRETYVVPRNLLEENKWRVARYGLDAEIVEFEQERTLSMRDSIRELLDMVDDVADDLGTRSDLNYIRKLVDDPRGTGADRQIALYKKTGSIYAVNQYLLQQTMEGIPLDSTEQYLVR